MYLKSFIHLVQMIQVKELDEVAQQVKRIASAARCIIPQTFVPEEDKMSVSNFIYNVTFYWKNISNSRGKFKSHVQTPMLYQSVLLR